VAAGFSLDGLTTQVWSAGIAALTLLLVFLVLSAATLLGRKPRAAEAFRLCACVILAALAFSWVLTAALFAFALVGADICVAPAVALLRVLNSSLSGGQATPGVAYTTAAYFSSPCGTTPPAGALGYIQAEQNAATAMLNGVSQLQLQLSNESVAVGDAARPFIAALTTLAAQGSEPRKPKCCRFSVFRIARRRVARGMTVSALVSALQPEIDFCTSLYTAGVGSLRGCGQRDLLVGPRHDRLCVASTHGLCSGLADVVAPGGCCALYSRWGLCGGRCALWYSGARQRGLSLKTRRTRCRRYCCFLAQVSSTHPPIRRRA